MRSMLPRKAASVRVRAPVMRRSLRKIFATSVLGEKPEAGSFVHDMF
jgi:hypothetical protein